jgi:hypothetical protein
MSLYVRIDRFDCPLPVKVAGSGEFLENKVVPLGNGLIVGVRDESENDLAVLYVPPDQGFGSICLPWHKDDEGLVGRFHAGIRPVSEFGAEYIPLYQPEGLVLKGSRSYVKRTLRHPIRGRWKGRDVLLHKDEPFEMVAGERVRSIVHIGKVFHLGLFRKLDE